MSTKEPRDMMRLELEQAIRECLTYRARERYMNCSESYKSDYHDFAIDNGLPAVIEILEQDARPGEINEDQDDCERNM